MITNYNHKTFIVQATGSSMVFDLRQESLRWNSKLFLRSFQVKGDHAMIVFSAFEVNLLEVRYRIHNTPFPS
jgi:hypothetical protein